MVDATGIKFRLTPSDYQYSWHHAPQRQFIVNLDADVEVEVSSGEKRVIKRGEVFFVEDISGESELEALTCMCAQLTMLPLLVQVEGITQNLFQIRQGIHCSSLLVMILKLTTVDTFLIIQNIIYNTCSSEQ